MNVNKTIPQGYEPELRRFLQEIQEYINLLRMNPPIPPAEPGFLCRFSQEFPVLYQEWHSSQGSHDDINRIMALLLSMEEAKHQEKPYGLLEQCSDHLTFLLLNHLSRSNPDSPLPQDLMAGLYKNVPFLLDSICPIQTEFEEEYPEIYDYIWGHHIPVTQERGQQILDGLEDEEDFLAELREFLCDLFHIVPEENEDSEDDFSDHVYEALWEEIPSFSTFDLRPLFKPFG